MIARSGFQNLFQMAREVGEWDDRPVTPDISDPQVHLSRSGQAQPFFLICEKDTVVFQATGTGEIEFRHSGVLRTRMTIGDFVYVPAGTPSRIHPHEESLYLRLKALRPGLEATAWFCTTCNAEVWRHEYDASEISVQQGYLDGCQAFNLDEDARTCGSCGALQNQVDLSPYRWGDIAKLLTTEPAKEPAS